MVTAIFRRISKVWPHKDKGRRLRERREELKEKEWRKKKKENDKKIGRS
jgi:hypothetical protein